MKIMFTRIVNQPYGYYSVQGYDDDQTSFFPKPNWRYLDEYGDFAYPWYRHIKFSTLKEASDFAVWVREIKGKQGALEEVTFKI